MDKVAFLFPGQGSQYIGMGKRLCEQYATAQRTFEEAGEVLGYDVQAVAWGGPIDELTRTELAQPAILTHSVAAWRVVREVFGVDGYAAAGHSIGEYSALTCAGALDFADALHLVRLRGQFMQEAVQIGAGRMAAVRGLDRQTVERIVAEEGEAGDLSIACYNSSRQFVLSGARLAVERAERRLEREGAEISALRVSAPFHSPLMASAAAQLHTELERRTYGEFDLPVFANVTGKPYHSKAEIIPYLTLQMTEPVRWMETMAGLLGQGVTCAIELGPKSILKRLLRTEAPYLPVFALDDVTDMDDLKIHLNRVENKPTTVVIAAIAHAVATRNRNPDAAAYREGVVKPFRALQLMQDDLDAADRLPTDEQMEQALRLVQQIWTTKGVPLPEQCQRFEEIVATAGAAGRFQWMEEGSLYAGV